MSAYDRVTLAAGNIAPESVVPSARNAIAQMLRFRDRRSVGGIILAAHRQLPCRGKQDFHT